MKTEEWLKLNIVQNTIRYIYLYENNNNYNNNNATSIDLRENIAIRFKQTTHKVQNIMNFNRSDL